MNAFLKNTFWVVISCLALVGISPSTASAEEQLTEITWAHPTPERVSRFVVMISPEETTTPDTRWVEVGKPAGQSSATMSFYTALIPVSSEEYIAIGAVGVNGLMSAMTPWSPVPPSRPGQPLLVIEP